MEMNYYIPKDLPMNFLRRINCVPIEEVEIQQFENTIQNYCLDNVTNYLNSNNGSIQYGWIFSMLGRFVLKTHAHAVVHMENGRLICVTPPESKMAKIKFVRDESVKDLIVNNRLPVKGYGLVDSLIIEKFVSFENEQDVARLNGDSARVYEIYSEKLLLASEFFTYVSNNTRKDDPCYCGSSRKFKKCCGRRF
jgi:HTH-type transcriptional repressor of NAD biosynthesis genes